MKTKKDKKSNETLDNILADLEINNNELSQSIENRGEDINNSERLINILQSINSNINKILLLVGEYQDDRVSSLIINKEMPGGLTGVQRVIEGVFNGETMIGGDGKQYNIPANYASKSKLVEGDILKLTITKDGSFIYKQIGPIERKNLIATLAQDSESDEWYAVYDEKRWRLLTASVTYFHGEPGDEVVIVIPKDSQSKWAAVENIIKK